MLVSSDKEKKYIKSAKKWGVLPFNSERISDKYLVVSILGGWCILDEREFCQFQSHKVGENSPLYEKLRLAGMLLTESNQENLVNGYRNLSVNLFSLYSIFIDPDPPWLPPLLLPDSDATSGDLT